MAPKRAKKSTFEPKDLVLAKMHGFSAWPSFVMPEDMIPEAVWRAKKKTTNFCVIFIPDGDYYWLSEKNLESLSEEKLDKKLLKTPRGKVKPKGGKTLHVNDALLASKDLKFDEFMDSLESTHVKGGGGDYDISDEEVDGDEDVDEADEIAEDEDGDEEEDAEQDDHEEIAEDKDTKPRVQNRRNGNRPKVEEGEEEDEEEEGETSIGSRNKRKRDAANNSRKATKLSESYPKTPTASKPGVDGKKPEPSPPRAKTPEEIQHQLWLCRIKLQRSLIQRNQPVTPANPLQYPPPTIDELLVARLILHRLSDFPITLDLLSKTKIHKVLKCILRIEDLEYFDSFKLHEKCEELLAKWAPLIEDLKAQKLSLGNIASEDSTKTNGNKPKLLENVHSVSKGNGANTAESAEAKLAQAQEDSEISAVENVSAELIKKESLMQNSSE